MLPTTKANNLCNRQHAHTSAVSTVQRTERGRERVICVLTHLLIMPPAMNPRIKYRWKVIVCIYNIVFFRLFHVKLKLTESLRTQRI
jgi:hypothetical protein